jgi:hypothetical protein
VIDVADERIWLHFPATGGYFHCPTDAAEAWRARGWEPSAPPVEVNQATAHWPAPAAPESAAPAVKKKSTTPPPGENEEKIDG